MNSEIHEACVHEADIVSSLSLSFAAWSLGYNRSLGQDHYKNRRELFFNSLSHMGITITKPQTGFSMISVQNDKL